MNAADAAALDAAVLELKRLVALPVPASCSDWSFGKTVDFKEAHKKAARAAASRSPKLDTTRAAINALRPFYGA